MKGATRVISIGCSCRESRSKNARHHAVGRAEAVTLVQRPASWRWPQDDRVDGTRFTIGDCRIQQPGAAAGAAKLWTHEEVWHRAGEGYTGAVSEFHIVGGLHPTLGLDWYCEMLRGLKERFPQVHLKAFTMVEISYFAQRTKLSTREVLMRLHEAGMDSMPGGGAEIFSDRVRRIICDHKIDGNDWLRIAREAHEMGLRSNCTMLYGHVETEEDRADHLIKLRALQDDTKGFQTFIPLAFHPDNTDLEHCETTSGFSDLKNIAVARLMLDNIEHIKAYWVMMTPRMAQISLRFGADDLDGTIIEEHIYHDAGSTVSQSLRRQDLMRLIRERIGTIAGLKTATVVKRLPKTPSGKILRSIMRRIADGEPYEMPATIEDAAVLPEIEEAVRVVLKL